MRIFRHLAYLKLKLLPLIFLFDRRNSFKKTLNNSG